MTRDRIYDYFISKDYNCAEAILHALDDEYHLGVPREAFKLVGGFGGGMACGRACGALCGGCAAISFRLIEERAHATPELKAEVSAFAEKFVDRFGSDACSELVKTYKKEGTRCLDMIRMAADLADECFAGMEEGENAGMDARTRLQS